MYGASRRVLSRPLRRRLPARGRYGQSTNSIKTLRKEHLMNAVDILKYGQGTVLQTIEGFPESAWETPGACGVWSVKDIIAHLASHEQVLADALTTFLDGSPTRALSMF